MGLGVSVGFLAWNIAEGYDDQTEGAREDVQEINAVLTANGFAPHVEPETVPPFRNRSGLFGMPYSWIHYLRRAYAYAQEPEEFRPVAPGEDPTEDEAVEDETSMLSSHLLCHSDCEGYYVPIDFPEPLFDDTDQLTGGMLGSSQGALRELVETAPLLGITLRNGKLSDQEAIQIANEDSGPLYIERQVWLLLFESFRESIEQGTIVTFT